MNIELLRQHMEGHKIGVVVPCHNYGRYLQQCIDSIIEQTLPVDRLIVVNDASTDGTDAIFEQSMLWHKDSFTKVEYYNVDFKHANKTRNFGLSKLGDCDYLLMFDADNYMRPDFIERMGYALMQNPDAAYAYCDRWMLTDEKQELVEFPEFDARRFTQSNFVDFASLMHRRLYDVVGQLTEDEEFDVLEDWDYFFKASNKGFDGVHVAAPLYYYRLHPESKSYRIHENPERFQHMKRRILDRNALPR